MVVFQDDISNEQSCKEGERGYKKFRSERSRRQTERVADIAAKTQLPTPLYSSSRLRLKTHYTTELLLFCWKCRAPSGRPARQDVQVQRNIPIGFSITRSTVSENPDNGNSLAAQPAHEAMKSGRIGHTPRNRSLLTHWKARGSIRNIRLVSRGLEKRRSGSSRPPTRSHSPARPL